jgi:zinc transport system permease protein
MAGAFVAAIVVALFLGVPRNANDGNSDARVQVIWSIGMALGIVFLALTPGYAVDLMSYLFGNLLLSSVQSILWTGAVAVGLIGLYGWRFRCIETICFDEEFARVIGLPVRPMNIVIYIATALSVVVLIQSVGLILVISLMTIPSLIAFALSRSLAQMIGIAIMLNSVFAFVGLWVSYVYDLPSGASIILCAGAAYLAWQVARHCRRALRSSPGDRGAVLSGSQPNS